MSTPVGGCGAELSGLVAAAEQVADESAREKQLHVRREVAGPVPAEASVEDLPPAWPERREDVLEIGCRRRKAAEGRRVERAAPRRQKAEAGDAARDLEAAAGDVLMRDPVAQQVGRRS